jgi:hypothetical protein
VGLLPGRPVDLRTGSGKTGKMLFSLPSTTSFQDYFSLPFLRREKKMIFGYQVVDYPGPIKRENQ